MSNIEGRWVDDPSKIDSTALGMLAGSRNASAVWVGVKGGTEPRISIVTRNGQHQQIEHSPIETFTRRLDQALAGMGIAGPASAAATDPAEFVLNAGRDTNEAAQADRSVAEILGIDHDHH